MSFIGYLLSFSHFISQLLPLALLFTCSHLVRLFYLFTPSRPNLLFCLPSLSHMLSPQPIFDLSYTLSKQNRVRPLAKTKPTL